MQTYSQFLDSITGTICGVKTDDETLIPLDPRNADYQRMKKDLLAGATLLNGAGAAIDGAAWAGTLQ